ncbi:glycoside hydrolase [Aestuariibaculum sp. M13]|uniref:GH39 family glycosyl hydrolase n=1 Tax=Aestuariibaculum sp. M13 TaxID=2967132 RepID=UPI002159FCAE|nr:glycoside hydrolase [Aestuariibaculum sp. M13]MCR8668002.1 glycoside hydrolase [Aestuariibaculum sp. M13]
MSNKHMFYVFIFYLATTGFSGFAQNRHITVDFLKEKGKTNSMFKECIGAGRANEGLRADWQQQLKIAKQDCDFKYIRMHGLLCDDMAVYKTDRQGKTVYNYQYIDVLYDYILSIGMKPFVELGFMPSAMASGNQTIFWWKGNVTPPKDYNEWGKLVENLVQHWTDRYGSDEVRTWYFEVWNEPNLTPGFWTGTQAEYFKLYEYAAQAVKQVNLDYRIGGPATAGAAWEPEMIKYCEQNKVPLDFISTHAYGVDVGFLDEYGGAGTVLSKNEWSVSEEVKESKHEILESSRPDLELHYTEWSSSYTPADPLHDSYHEAAYILQKIKQIGNAANSMSYWVFTDIFEEPGPRFTPFHGGFGLMNIQGIKKPAYHAYAFLNTLGNLELENSDRESWVTKSEAGDVQVLLWDYTYTLPENTNNQDYYNRNLPSKEKGQIEIEILNIPKGNYQLEISKIGYKHNDPFTHYLELNKPSQLTKAQVEMLKDKSSGKPEIVKRIKIPANQIFKQSMPLNENEVCLLNFKRL